MVTWLGTNHLSLLPLTSFFQEDENILVDLPGFGESPPPDNEWDTEDYARFLHDYLNKHFNNNKERYIIGHSLGARIALRYAYLFPNHIHSTVLISAAGLQRKRSILFKCKAKIFKIISKSIKIIESKFNLNLKKLSHKILW